MRVATTVLLGVLALGSARAAREGAGLLRDDELVADAPYAPSPGAARYLSLGYHELAADLFFARLMPYFGGSESTTEGVAALVEAIVALDPKFKRAYDWGVRAMTMVGKDIDQAMYLRALAILEIGARQFPDDWKTPYHAGQIYMVDLVTKDPAQRREWDEKGALLLETAIRKPKAPSEAAMSVSFLRTRLGQRERAIEGLREMLLITPDDKARKRIIDELAKLEDSSADEIAAEIYESRRNFEREWKAERPAMTPSLFLLIGPRAKPSFDMGALATGGRDVVGSQPFERLDPPTDPPPEPATPPAPLPAP
ncbi:MAG TPA: hypothetical protein VIU61_23055 [Kofleriaceae bacterium]